ncbi:hydroxyisourate hydrolase [Leucobacter albus]|uniref:5-hydroxyisourate hydrolase n=1 Tax=Leucobacter albus TaxID=272210 RepID=A0ABW3TP29_9MICO
MSLITTHVLDAALGGPASDIAVRLLDAAGSELATGVTDADGRVSELGPESLEPGDYSLVFAVAPYFARTGTPTFYPVVTIHFTVRQGDVHYHVPLLLSPFAYSTYRGS